MFTYLLLWTFIEGETNYKKILFYNLQRIRKTCFSYKVNLLALGASEQILYTNIFLIDHYQNNCSLPKLLKNEFGACETGRGGKRGGGGSDELAQAGLGINFSSHSYITIF